MSDHHRCTTPYILFALGKTGKDTRELNKTILTKGTQNHSGIAVLGLIITAKGGRVRPSETGTSIL